MRFVSPSLGFVVLYTAAFVGAFVSFIPFVAVLLPLKVASLADPGSRVELLSIAGIGGAIVASIANILFGSLSDRSYRRSGSRRPWIASGLALLIPCYALLLQARDQSTLLIAVAALQIAINMVFAPLVALMADEVPDDRKGLVSALLGTAQPFASLVAMGMSLRGLGNEAMRHGLLYLLVAVLTLPLLLMMRERTQRCPSPVSPGKHRRDFALIWIARLLVQIAGNGLTAFGLFYFLAVASGNGGKPAPEALGERAAMIFAVTTVLALPVTIAAGRLSDKRMQRKPLLLLAAIVMAGGLLIMAQAKDWLVASIGFGAAVCGMSVFLAVQSALTMQLLPSPDHRGRDLGLFNLTNTMPAMAAPLLALVLTPEELGYGPWLIVLALGVLAGGGIIAVVHTQR